MELLSLPALLTLRSLEDYLYSEKDKIKNSTSIIIDFSNVEFLEIGTFFYIFSIVDDAVHYNKSIKIILPKSIKVRNIFRIWRFPIILRELTNIPFKDIVVEEDLKYFGENSKLKGDYYNILGITEEGLYRLLDKGFFSLTKLMFDSVSNKREGLISETKRWEDAFIKAVLMKHLKCYDEKTKNMIPRIIIYECLTNSIRHPNANALVTGSFFDKTAKLFTINYWDNGTSILDTIKKPVVEEKSIKADFDESRYRTLFSTFFVKYLNNGLTDIEIINSDVVPTKKSEDYKLLLSTFFPGISSDPKGQKSYIENPDIDVKSPGMGLTFLLKVVVDFFQGSLSVRTKNYFLNFSAASKEVQNEIEKTEQQIFDNRYKCKILNLKGSDCYFHGNMITIRLPLN